VPQQDFRMLDSESPMPRKLSDEEQRKRRKEAEKLKNLLAERLAILDIRKILLHDASFGNQRSQATITDPSLINTQNFKAIELIQEKTTICKLKEDLEFDQRFFLREFLGTGAYGVVILVKQVLEPFEKSALKIINKERLSERALGVLHNEALALSKLNHPSVVGFKQIYETSQHLFIEMEYVRGGSL